MEIVDNNRNKKRHRPDFVHPSSPISKRLYILNQAQLDSSILSDVACPSSTSLKVEDRLSCGTSAVDSQSTITSVPASELSSTSACMDLFLEGATKEFTKPFHDPSIYVSDANAEVSEVSFERPRIVNSRSGSTSSSDYQSIVESGFSRYRERANTDGIDCKLQARPGSYELRHKVGRAHEHRSFSSRQSDPSSMQRRAKYTTVKSFSSVADETGSLWEDPTGDLVFEEKRPKYTNSDAYRADRESYILGITGGFQSAGFSDVKNKSSTSLHVITTGMKKSGFNCEVIPEMESGGNNKAGILQELETESTLRMGQEYSNGHDSDEDFSQVHMIDKENEDVPRPSYVLSSGRLSLQQEAQLGRRAPTIDQDFEEYFSALML